MDNTDNRIFETFLIQSLGGRYTRKTIESFLISTGFKNNYEKEINIIKEESSRESTLNKILLSRKRNLDLLIFVDDIEFRENWYDNLNKYRDKGDIIGFSMLKPDKKTIQDFGYDFASIDGNITYKGMHKNKLLSEIKRVPYRECSAVCGCLMFIKKQVFNKIDHFPFGYNRWSELLFCNLARKEGFKTIVLKSNCVHLGISTKNNKNINLSSISWTIEKELWEITKKDNLINTEIPINDKFKFFRKIDNKLLRKLSTSSKILFYGCGSICELFLNNGIELNIDITSSLEEEKDNFFYNKRVLDINKVDFEAYDFILITPVGYKDKIIKNFPKKIWSRLNWTKITEKNNQTIFSYD
tara:strand:- start:5410 stop:6477 length:1068 start_codon:yes stop_codon:yes gene_type:complete